MNKNIIPVVWGLDKKYVLQAFVVMHSILKNSRKKYHFYILTADQIAEQVQEYTVFLKDRYDNFNISIKPISQDIFINAQIYNQHLSKATYFRLLIPDLLCEYNKCIYLDCDILVNGDLAELFNIDMEDCYLAGVKDCHIIADTPKEREHEKVLGIPSREKYINSGVLLMNLKKLRNDRLVTDFFAQMRRENWYEDQDVLNYCCYPHIKILPLKYNLFHFYYGKSIRFLYHLDYANEDFCFEEPFIVHMGGKWKPWNYRKVKCADKWWGLAEIFKNTYYFQEYQKISERRENIDTMFEAISKNRDKQFVIWGYTPNGRRLCDMIMAKGYSNIVAIADNDKDKWSEEYRNIPVKGIEWILNKNCEIFWIISNQLAFEEVRQQILNYGIGSQNIIHYINDYVDNSYLLSLDEKFYGSEIEKIIMFEYTKEFPRYDQRKKYILQILTNPELFPKQYEYLNERYRFEYWYGV